MIFAKVVRRIETIRKKGVSIGASRTL